MSAGFRRPVLCSQPQHEAPSGVLSARFPVSTRKDEAVKITPRTMTSATIQPALLATMAASKAMTNTKSV